MQYFFSSDISNSKIFLSKEESNHCISVLRHEKGDIINVIDGLGGLYKAKIIQLSSRLELDIISKTQQEKQTPYIHIIIAPTKSNHRMEMFIEKAVEIGVNEISFVACSNSERRKINLARFNKIALTAMKQSAKAYSIKINDIKQFTEVISTVSQKSKYLGHLGRHPKVFLRDVISVGNSFCLLIGPEGDFSDEELNKAISNDFRLVALSNSRLRTETAGIVGCVILNEMN